jgi:hypothetical protein
MTLLLHIGRQWRGASERGC